MSNLKSKYFFFFFLKVIFYPKRPNKDLFKNLVTQCEKMGLTFVDSMPEVSDLNNDFSVVVDALFGFSFKPPVR